MPFPKRKARPLVSGDQIVSESQPLRSSHPGSIRLQLMGKIELGSWVRGKRSISLSRILKGGSDTSERLSEGREPATRGRSGRFQAALGYDFSMNSFLTERINETLSGEQADERRDQKSSETISICSIAKHKRSPAFSHESETRADVRVQSLGGLPEMNVQLIPSKLVQFGSRPVATCSTRSRRPIRDRLWRRFMTATGPFYVSVILESKSRTRYEHCREAPAPDLDDVRRRSPSGPPTNDRPRHVPSRHQRWG
jgi:hypothetical protein